LKGKRPFYAEELRSQDWKKASHAWMNQGNDLDDTLDCAVRTWSELSTSRAREEFSQLTECAKLGHWLSSWRKRMPSAYNISQYDIHLPPQEIQCIPSGPFRGNSHMLIPCNFSFLLPGRMFCTYDIEQVFCLDPLGLGKGRPFSFQLHFRPFFFYVLKCWCMFFSCHLCISLSNKLTSLQSHNSSINFMVLERQPPEALWRKSGGSDILKTYRNKWTNREFNK
jgi:hypothetical protein